MRLKKGTKIESQRDISKIRLQAACSNCLKVFYRLFVGYFLFCRLFAVRDPYLDFSNVHMVFPHNFRGSEKKTHNLRTDGLTERWTDKPTDAPKKKYR